MADEITQACQIEIEGIKMAVAGSVKTVKFLAEAFKAIITSMKDFRQHISGAKSIKSIYDISEGPPVVLNVDRECLEKVIEMAKKNKCHFYELRDLNPDDNKSPILIPSQEAAVWEAILKQCLKQEVEKEEGEVQQYDDKIAEKKEALLTASPEERKLLQVDLDGLESAKSEVEKKMDLHKEDLSKEHLTMSFTEYLLSGKGTEFEKDPDKAVSEMEKGVPLTKGFPADECFQPLRDPGSAPEGGFTFYIPESGATVTRQFVKDEDTGLMYSNYTFKNKDGVINNTFSDKNVTKENWNKEVLPKFYEMTGILSESNCIPFHNQNHLKKYLELHNKIKPKSEENYEKAKLEDKGNFSSPDVEQEVQKAMGDDLKGTASAEREKFLSVTVPAEAVTQKEGYLNIKLDDNQVLRFPNAEKGIAENGKISFKFDKTKLATLEDTMSGKKNLVDAKSISDVLEKAFEHSGEELLQVIDNAKKQ